MIGMRVYTHWLFHYLENDSVVVSVVYLSPTTPFCQSALPRLTGNPGFMDFWLVQIGIV
jgi:hypothetical protein